jgi:hypothetical protein
MDRRSNPAKNEDSTHYDKEGNPTFNIAADGTVDWYTYSGYRRYNEGMRGLSWP